MGFRDNAWYSGDGRVPYVIIIEDWFGMKWANLSETLKRVLRERFAECMNNKVDSDLIKYFAMSIGTEYVLLTSTDQHFRLNKELVRDLTKITWDQVIFMQKSVALTLRTLGHYSVGERYLISMMAAKYILDHLLHDLRKQIKESGDKNGELQAMKQLLEQIIQFSNDNHWFYPKDVVIAFGFYK